MKSFLARFKRKKLDREPKNNKNKIKLVIEEFAELHMHPDGMEPYEPISGHMGQIVDSCNMRKYFDRAFGIKSEKSRSIQWTPKRQNH